MRRLKEVTNLGHSKAECRQAFCVIQSALHSDWTIQSPPALTWNAIFLLFLQLLLSIPRQYRHKKLYFSSMFSIVMFWGVRCYLCERQIATEWGPVTRSGPWTDSADRDLHWRAFLQGYGRCQLIRAPMMGNRQRTLYWWDIDESPLDWSHLWPAPGPDDHWGKVSAAFLTEYSSPVSLQ